MPISIVLGILIYGYDAWMLVRAIRKSRQGKCAVFV
ncbi:FeoB-associated Cys-rich membrane protein [Camelliibacillus cellulosilyticus]